MGKKPNPAARMKTVDVEDWPLFSLQKDGFEIHSGLFTDADLATLESAASNIDAFALSKGGGRNILSSQPSLLGIFKNERILAFLNQFLGCTQGLSEGLFLNKKAEANWLVAWHQDLFVSVKAGASIEGYFGWTTKQGKPYVQPPTKVLEQSLWIRLNLDDNDVDNGCLKVVPGSHLLGKIPPEEVSQVVERHGEVAIPCRKGDVILFRPLLLHASSKSLRVSQRRVIQVLYSGYAFQNGLEWPF